MMFHNSKGLTAVFCRCSLNHERLSAADSNFRTTIMPNLQKEFVIFMAVSLRLTVERTPQLDC